MRVLVVEDDRKDFAARGESVVEQLLPIAHSQSVVLRCAPTWPVVVHGDAGRLPRMVLNRVGDALEFTRPGGHVTVRVSADGTSARLQVQDTGIGLSADDAARVFERVFRAERSTCLEGR